MSANTLVPPSDESMHETDGSSNFNESVYFNVYDTSARIGGFLRLGNRPGEGHAELTVAVYLPDERVAFYYGRPEISGNEEFRAGGMSVSVVAPFEDVRTTYAGPILLLDDPDDLLDPKSAFARESVHAELDLVFEGLAPAWGGELGRQEDANVAELLEAFWRGHYEQHTRGRGSIQIDGRSWTVDGYGLRDHSWGPRTWQSIHWYRWLTGNLDERTGFILSLIGARDGRLRAGGALLIDGTYVPAESVAVRTEWSLGRYYQRSLQVTVVTAEGRHVIHGHVSQVIPLRHRRKTAGGEVELSRITEGLTRWTWDGQVGYGLSEYLDSMAGDMPAGIGH
jgi:hypothetical protein